MVSDFVPELPPSAGVTPEVIGLSTRTATVAGSVKNPDGIVMTSDVAVRLLTVNSRAPANTRLAFTKPVPVSVSVWGLVPILRSRLSASSEVKVGGGNATLYVVFAVPPPPEAMLNTAGLVRAMV